MSRSGRILIFVHSAVARSTATFGPVHTSVYRIFTGNIKIKRRNLYELHKKLPPAPVGRKRPGHAYRLQPDVRRHGGRTAENCPGCGGGRDGSSCGRGEGFAKGPGDSRQGSTGRGKGPGEGGRRLLPQSAALCGRLLSGKWEHADNQCGIPAQILSRQRREQPLFPDPGGGGDKMRGTPYLYQQWVYR